MALPRVRRIKARPTGPYRSRMEAKLAPLLLEHGAVYEKLRLKYSLDRVYTPDFSLPNGVILEVKGWFTPADRTKMLAVKAAHPELDIRMVLACPDKRLTKARHGLTEATWCDKHGFPWCSGGIPDRWLH